MKTLLQFLSTSKLSSLNIESTTSPKDDSHFFSLFFEKDKLLVQGNVFEKQEMLKEKKIAKRMKI